MHQLRDIDFVGRPTPGELAVDINLPRLAMGLSTQARMPGLRDPVGRHRCSLTKRQHQGRAEAPQSG